MPAIDFYSQTVYQIYVRSFYDSDGDGIGDIRGVIEKISYIASLGIEYIWLNPIFPSSQADNGYDISDYCAIDPLFGTMTDLEELIQVAAGHGIGIILDMVFNHTSTEHAWFQKALQGDPYYKAFYFFRDGSLENDDLKPPTNWLSKFGGSAWQYTGWDQEFYLHLYSEKQADLNWKNPNVRAQLKKILAFWIQKGIKGFRFDVINLISKPNEFIDDPHGDGRCFYTDGPDMEKYLKEIHQAIHELSPDEDLLLVGELSSTSSEKCIPYSKPENKELSMLFHFQHLKTDYGSEQDKWTLAEVDYPMLTGLFHQWQLEMAAHNAHDALFWNNHDQPRALTRFTGDQETLLTQRAALLAATIHFMRGTPYIYMGEEIGMTNPEFDDIEEYRDVETKNFYQQLIQEGKTKATAIKIIQKRSRDNARTPMQWNTSEHAGFTTATPWIKVNRNYRNVNVAAEEEKNNGILAFYKQLITLRKKYNIIQHGSYQPILTEIKNIIAYTRENEVQYLLCINNYNNTSLSLDKSNFTKFAALESTILASNYAAVHVNLAADLDLKPFESLVVLFNK